MSTRSPVITLRIQQSLSLSRVPPVGEFAQLEHFGTSAFRVSATRPLADISTELSAIGEFPHDL